MPVVPYRYSLLPWPPMRLVYKPLVLSFPFLFLPRALNQQNAQRSAPASRQRSASSCCRWKFRSPDVASSTGLPARVVDGAVELGLPRAKVQGHSTGNTCSGTRPGLGRYSAMGGVSADLTAPIPSPTWSPGARYSARPPCVIRLTSW